jgi:hypothetical protein
VTRDVRDENEAAATELVFEACEIVYRMTANNSLLPKNSFEKYFRPRIRKALLEARIKEAERCEAYGVIGSPRVVELKQELAAEEFEIAKLKQEGR